MTVKEIQSLLSDDEAMVLFAVTVKDSFVVAITRENFDWKPIGRGSEGLSGLVADFRRGLDVANASDATGKSSLFNLEFANWLYQHLLGSVEALVKDKRSLLIVPAGALTALPFHLLVTEKPPAAIPEKLEGYRDAAWLLKRHAVSVLPSVASLKSLRAFARRDFAVKPMTGFGDPLFNPAQEGVGDKRAPARSAARGVTTAAYTDFWRGAGVDRASTRPRAAATAGYRRRTPCGREKPRRCRFRRSSRQRRQRDRRQAGAAGRLRHRLFCHARPRRR